MAKRRRKSDELFLQAMACGANVETAARRAGISRATAFRRVAAPDFQKTLQDVRREIIFRTLSVLNAATSEAARTLIQLLGTAHSSSARLGAARAIIELSCKLRDHEDFDARLRSIEERFEDGNHVLT
ncbi:MAG: hypothetical protein JNJ77_05145 [Planctomycetia bacterium]|nr:hypothetical protein [Planctomycetia bacterium]